MNPSSSRSEAANPRLSLPNANSVDEAEKRLLSAVEPPIVDCRRLRNTPRESSQFLQYQNGKNVLLVDAQQDRPRSNLRDINAMSVASIYDRENNEIMDADK